ncbi:hypothetical protein SPHINGO8AM_70190 [Sphingomonas sp. 8AM]|nr:hypothetical protein SPHINGO8AM_70190 [Sphingomonas sp. 8AM]
MAFPEPNAASSRRRAPPPDWRAQRLRERAWADLYLPAMHYLSTFGPDSLCRVVFFYANRPKRHPIRCIPF